MIASYDWIIHARQDSKYRDTIMQIMDSHSVKELAFKKYLCVKFYGPLEYAEVHPYPKESEFSSKVIPVRITYAGLRKMLTGDFNNIVESDIQFL
ncbi:hypothetical protein [Acidaminococcus timonensis]|uniref:hypothetical protein n=1 Tax=Acidaminococcus timonensis TaxID=1871002 RepID=UPI002941C2AB|nr:hypothetical protein [Acidaminococcus timonensis]